MRTMEGEFCGLTTRGFESNRDPVPISIDRSNLVKGFNPLSRHGNFMDLTVRSKDPQAFNTLSPSSSGTSSSSEGDSPEETDESDAVLKYISHILMEEDLEGKIGIFQDGLALQAFEKSFADALGEKKYPPSPHKPTPSLDQEVTNLDNSITSRGSNDSIKKTVNNLKDTNLVHFGSSFLSRSHSDSCSPSSGCDTVDGLADSPVSILQVSNTIEGKHPVRHFNGGFEESSQLLTTGGDRLVIHLEDGMSVPPTLEEDASEAAKMEEKVGSRNSLNGSRSRKNHEREEGDDFDDERSNKQSAIYTEETELSDMFDKVLLCDDAAVASVICNNNELSLQDEASKKVQPSEQVKGQKNRSKKGKRQGNTREMVDLTTLLTHCAQAVASNDHRTAREQLKQIKQHSSPFGDGSQRLAHCFANGLEARLDGTGGQVYAGYTAFSNKRRSVSDILKAYHVYISTCPFKKMSNMLANRTIVKVAKKATSLHIIDFGILYGFQWPCLIQRLSKRPGGPPKLRITGIEIPQSGFRPANWVDETGYRLDDYCKRFGVPFEYSSIAQKWDTIQLEDFKIDRNELLVVNCLYRFRHLLDETVVANSPRDAVLNLIKRINPDIFIHGVVNGTYNAPFFVTRFREALFHFSALFDMFEAVVSRDDKERMLYETEIFGGDAINVIACEGSERVERPETYKQWQGRNARAGFKQLPLDQDILKQVRTKVKLHYHKDFVVDENSNWMLQGWKGRVIHALSCWRPA